MILELFCKKRKELIKWKPLFYLILHHASIITFLILPFPNALLSFILHPIIRNESQKVQKISSTKFICWYCPLELFARIIYQPKRVIRIIFREFCNWEKFFIIDEPRHEYILRSCWMLFSNDICFIIWQIKST